MKIINKYMVDTLASILDAIQRGDWVALYCLYLKNHIYGKDWDDAEFDKLTSALPFLRNLCENPEYNKGNISIPNDDIDFLLWLHNYLQGS